MKILGIYREKIFSHKAVEADQKILDQLLHELSINLQDSEWSNSFSINTIHPEIDKKKISNDYDVILTMAQDDDVLTRLNEVQNNGSIVINSSNGIRNCYRTKLSERILAANENYPSYLTINTESILDESTLISSIDFSQGHWIKRGDFHAVCEDDVVFVNSQNDFLMNIAQFRKRKIEKVILQKHISGEIIKFYGVGDKFFKFRPVGQSDYQGNATKISASLQNTTEGKEIEIVADYSSIIKRSFNVAKSLDLDIYGGDFILSKDGTVNYIDFNDWPSFRTCVNEAAVYMSNLVRERMDKVFLGLGNSKNEHKTESM